MIKNQSNLLHNLLLCAHKKTDINISQLSLPDYKSFVMAWDMLALAVFPNDKLKIFLYIFLGSCNFFHTYSPATSSMVVLLQMSCDLRRNCIECMQLAITDTDELSIKLARQYAFIHSIRCFPLQLTVFIFLWWCKWKTWSSKHQKPLN